MAKKQDQNGSSPIPPREVPHDVQKVDPEAVKRAIDLITRPPASFTQAIATEIVKNLTSIGKMTARPFTKSPQQPDKKQTIESPVFIDTSVLIDGRILPIVNSGFFAGTLCVTKFVLEELQHIADSSDQLRRTKGRRGLDVVSKLKAQKTNQLVKTKIMTDDPQEIREVDHKLVQLSKKMKARLLTVDFNLAQLARAQGVKVMNINDLAQAIKVSLTAGEELTIRISHEGKEREQGVGYLEDGTMVVVDGAKTMVGQEVAVIISKVHQTPAGQLFFSKLK